jgi:polyisoprenyl-phosphate glycosyltransferase
MLPNKDQKVANETVEISIVVPVYNEAEAIDHNLRSILRSVQNLDNIVSQVIVVDDGSTDGTSDIVLKICENEPGLDLVVFNRNFGKEAAMLAGLNYSRGDAVIVMDSDLQHPPSLVPEMLGHWFNGYEVVEACKKSRGEERLPYKLFAKSFYLFFEILTKIDLKNKTDYKLLDRKVVDSYLGLPEKKRFFRGMIPWLGYRTQQVFFDVPVRESGSSSWSATKLLQLATTALSNFTSTPLHLVTLLGAVYLVASVMLGGWVLYQTAIGSALSGFPTVILLVLLTGSLILFSLGQIGVYLEQVFDESKGRPPYVINSDKTRIKNRNQG